MSSSKGLVDSSVTFQQDLKTLSYFAGTINLQWNFSEVRSGKNFSFLKRFLDYKRIELNERFRNQRDSGSRSGVTKLCINRPRGSADRGTSGTSCGTLYFL